MQKLTASRPDVPCQFLLNRKRTAMRCSAVLAGEALLVGNIALLLPSPSAAIWQRLPQLLNDVSGKLADLTLSSRYRHLLHAQRLHLANPCSNLLRRARQGRLLDHPLGHQWSMLWLKLGTIPSVEVQMAGLDRGIGGAVGSLKGHEVLADVSWELVRVCHGEGKDVAFCNDYRPHRLLQCGQTLS